MSRIFHRAAALVVGITLPLGAWALVAPSNIDNEYAGVVQDLEIAPEVSFEVAEFLDPIEAKSALRTADRDDEPVDPATQPKASTAGCCVWFYHNGNWYCYPC
ncbi:MAG TPA: hypothetical protein VMR74_00795 [Gammaproteobacteria bacterium]|nr:hypothetical protein [Gammaproteobacteria bacterium]